jgi:hypothetical protein
MKLISYLYCRFYQLMVSVGNGDIAGFASIGLLTMMISLHLAAVYGILYYFGLDFEISKVTGLVVVLVVIGLLYFLLFYKGRANKLLERLESEDRKDYIKGRIIIILYIILSFILFGFGMYLMASKNSAAS